MELCGKQRRAEELPGQLIREKDTARRHDHPSRLSKNDYNVKAKTCTWMQVFAFILQRQGMPGVIPVKRLQELTGQQGKIAGRTSPADSG